MMFMHACACVLQRCAISSLESAAAGMLSDLANAP